MEKLIFFPPPAVALLLLAVAFGLDRLLPHLPSVHLPGLGVLLMVSGIFLGLMALGNFRRRRTTFVPHGAPSTLVTEGPYLWTRNPMYLGLLTALLGIACYLGKLPFYLAAPGFFLVIDRHHIPYEEAKLLGLFGEAYAEFRRRVARWL
jgi:protein-S-isoprenylcysteine O-methyltransferase Ste14